MSDDAREQIEAHGARILEKSITSQATLRAAVTHAIEDQRGP